MSTVNVFSGFSLVEPAAPDSLCSWLISAHLSGFTLVIAPLVSLMEDQLMYLKSINVPAVTLNASSSKVKTLKHFLIITTTTAKLSSRFTHSSL